MSARRERSYRFTLVGDSLSVQLEELAPIEAADSKLKPIGITGDSTSFSGFTSLNLRQVIFTVPQPETDFVLVQAGTNDIIQHRTKLINMQFLLNAVAKKFPTSQILVAPIPPSDRIPEAERQSWNEATAAMVARMPHSRFLPECRLDSTDYAQDRVHLTVKGYEKVRRRWIHAINDSLESRG